jgi:CHAD domain-containing protein
LRFFSSFAHGADYDALWDAFGELRTHLRETRDLDVLIAEVIVPAMAEAPVAGAETLMQELEARRAAAHAVLLDTLRRPATAALFFRFALWLSIGDWTTQIANVKAARARPMPLPKFARRKFAAVNDKFEACCADLAEATSEERHRTRIRAKNMRYAAEFFESLVRSKVARRRFRDFLKPVKELQTVLGEWNDVLVARRFLAGFAEPLTGRKVPPLAAPAVALADRIQLLGDGEFLERSAQACQALVAGEPFWRKLG